MARWHLSESARAPGHPGRRPGPALGQYARVVLMASLADQLKAIRPSKASGLRGAGGGLVQRPSLLFTPSEAADLDSDAIYSIGISGLAELSKLDPTLSRFEKTLFVRSATEFRREQQTADVLRVRLDPLSFREIKYPDTISFGRLWMPPSAACCGRSVHITYFDRPTK